MEDWRRKRIEEVYARWEQKGSARARPSPDSTSRPGGLRPSVTLPPRQPRPQQFSGTRRYTSNRRRALKLTPDSALGENNGRSFVPSLGVDTSALHSANSSKSSSFSLCCQTCLPHSRCKLRGDSSSSGGVYNLLQSKTRQYRRFPWRFFPYLSHVFFAEMNYSMPDHRRDVLASTRVQEAIRQSAGAIAEADNAAAVVEGSAAYREALREQRKRASHVINGMSSAVYKPLVRVVAWLLFWVFGKLFNKLTMPRRHVRVLQEAQKRGVPLVFLPCHKSHMDYLIITFVLFNLGIKVPRIAAGNNLRLPFISWLISHLGGFFIQRKLDRSGTRDVLYRKCLHESMEQMLASGENMEFFIEGSRTRSGKLGMPKAGLLSVLVDAVEEGVVEDILLIPTSISYDKPLEKKFVRHELMGGIKTPETFLEAVRGAVAMMTESVGSARVDIAQPFSLQEYLSSSTVSADSLLEVSHVGQYNSMAHLPDLAKRTMVTGLSHHLAYDISTCGSMMSPNLIAFLFLTKFRSGATLSELATSYSWLERMVVQRGRSVSFVGTPLEAVHYALHFLRPLVAGETGEGDPQAVPLDQQNRLSPRLCLPEVFDLQHQANQVVPLFALEAVIACSVRSLVGAEFGRNNSTLVAINQEKLLEEALFLSQILAREFVLAPPCVSLTTALLDSLERFTNSEMLKIVNDTTADTRGRSQRLPEEDDEERDWEESNADCTLQVSDEPEVVRHLEVLQNVLAPLLDSYQLVGAALLQLPSAGLQEGEFLKKVQGSLVDKAQKGLLSKVESCSMDTARNAVKLYTDLELLTLKGGAITVQQPARLLEVTESLGYFSAS